jgi:transposase
MRVSFVYIEKFKNNGTDYLRIMQSSYDKTSGKQRKKVIKNLGPLSRFDDGEADFLPRLREKFRNGEIELGGITATSEPCPYRMNFQTNDTHEIVMKNMGYFILEKFYKDLEIDKVLQLEKSRSKIEFDVDGLTKLLVFGRILKPESKKRTFEKRHNYLFPVTSSQSEHEIYRALDVLNKKSEAIQKRMNTKIKQSSIGRKTQLMYYDVTNYYFETLYNDDDTYQLDEAGNPVIGVDGKPIILEKGLRKKGVSKEKRKTPLVAMGLFIDQNGIPVSYNTFAGNTQDKTTFKEMIKSSLNQQELGKVVIVADNGNHAQENLYLLVTKGNGYIVSKSVKQKWNVKSHKHLNKLGEWIKDELGYEHKYNQKGILTFKSKSRIYERELKDKDGNTVVIKEKEVVFWSKGHYQKQLKENSKFIEYLESCVENPDKLKDKQRKSQEFIKVYQTDPKTGEILKTKPVTKLLTKKIEKQKEIMGWYCIVTSEVDKSDAEIINSYHRLSRIEDSFRVLKSNMDARPIYLWNNKRINAHFLICFISLTIVRLLQYHVLKYQGKDTFNLDGWEQGITTEYIQEALANHLVATDDNGVCLFNKKSDELNLIHKALGIDDQLERPTILAVNKLKNKINKMKFI